MALHDSGQLVLSSPLGIPEDAPMWAEMCRDSEGWVRVERVSSAPVAAATLDRLVIQT